MVPTESADREWIPNIRIGEEYDDRYRDEDIHYDRLGRFADFFGRDMPVHRHAQFIQIHYIENGLIDFHIDDQHYRLQGPALFLTPAAIPHSFRTAADAGGHVLTIHQSVVWQLLRREQRGEPLQPFDRGLCIAPAHLSQNQIEQWRLLLQFLDMLEKEWGRSRSGRRVIIENLTQLLLIMISRLGEHRAVSTEVHNEELLLFHRFSAAVEAHFREHKKLPYYAESLAITSVRLNKICQQIGGCSPKQVISERLLQEAKRLLSLGEGSSAEIAYALGFADPAYFNRFFKTQSGMTPLSYRKLAKH